MLIKLLLGVRKFRQEVFKEMDSLFQMLSNGQYPDALFITCADSRIVPNLLTQSTPGDLFVVRNVGNIVPPNETNNSASEIAAIEYALKVLKVRNIILCGHSDCGAMKGLLTPNLAEQLPSVASWLTHASSVVKKLQDKKEIIELESVIKQNVLVQIEHLKTYPIIAQKLASNELTIHGWFYKFESGEIFIYQENQEVFVPLEEALKLSIDERRNQIVKQVAHEYLAQFLQPKTADEFQKSRQLFSALKSDLSTIWEHLKPLVIERLWGEIGELYSNQTDQEFQELITSGVKIQLDNLKELKKNLRDSTGYYQFCRQHTLFKSVQSTEPLTTYVPHYLAQ
ncbi:carbonic anhydrase [Legionella clemsonensis]|uniref:carbonic anhydrase n=1 Tax=Legionella clemsonensis TaxID=1867846 RepID=A0A222P200_9GAMM|nr:carbonic anhydrase [Legionella clemsonensis]ASQ45872.1 Carbonic anhydrase [Legionella clemsonensis]